MNPTDKLELQIEENQDGSASVQVAPADEIVKNDDLINLINDGADAQDDGLDNDPDREAIREARREERKLKKQLHREKTRESSHLISALRKQNQDLAERVAIMEKKHTGVELARVDKAIEDAGVSVEYAKMQMRDAVTHSNGDALTKAQETWYEAQRKLESLKNIREHAAKATTSQGIQADPAVQMHASNWVDNNPWYDPAGKDLDSEIAQKIDKKLTDEGYDPKSEEYWEELDDRIAKYLPHRAERGYNSQNVKSQRPRSMVTSSGRDSIATTKSNEFRVSPQRVSAMKEAGVWDHPELRQKAIANYAKWDRENKQRSQ